MPEMRPLDRCGVRRNVIEDLVAAMTEFADGGIWAIHGSAEGKRPEEQRLIQQIVAQPGGRARIVAGDMAHNGAEIFNRGVGDDYFPTHFGIIPRTSSTDFTRPSRAAFMPLARACSKAT